MEHVARMRETRNEYTILAGQPGGKKPLGRPRGRWEDNIGLNLKEKDLEYVDWFVVGQNRDRWRYVVNTLMKLCFPYKTVNFSTALSNTD